MNNNALSGFLQVTVLGGEISPIKDAVVTVYSTNEGEGYIIASERTDNSGTTNLIPIPAYNEDYNVPTVEEKQVKRETVEVSAKGYYKSVRQNIPIFPGIVTREYVYMIPLSVKEGSMGEIYNDVIYSAGDAEDNGSFPGGDDSES